MYPDKVFGLFYLYGFMISVGLLLAFVVLFHYGKKKKVEEAVETTRNQVITYNGEIIAAFFHANSAGKTEDVKHIWGEEEIPYLKSVTGFEVDLEEDNKTLSSGEFEKIIKEKDESYTYKSGDVKILDYTTSGRVNSIQIGANIIKATEFRNLFGLKSTNIEIETSDDDITIKTKEVR
jgi:stage II sporulation protein D